MNVLVKAQLSFKNICQKYCYMACSKCFQSTSALQYEEYTSNLCESKQMVEPRCRFEVDVIDDSGIITASIFGNLAEKLLTFSASEVMEYAKKNTKLPLQEVHKALQSKLFLVQIRPIKLKIQMVDSTTPSLHILEGQVSCSSFEQNNASASATKVTSANVLKVQPMSQFEDNLPANHHQRPAFAFLTSLCHQKKKIIWIPKTLPMPPRKNRK